MPSRVPLGPGKFHVVVLVTRATCGRPSSSIFLSIFLSCRVWENYPEVLAYSFDEKAAHKVFK